MKRWGWFAAVAAVCAPMVLSLLFLLAVTWPKLDGFTQKMPQGLKASVASAIVQFDRGSDAAQERAARLDEPAARRVAARYTYSNLRLRELRENGGEQGDRLSALQTKAQDLEKRGEYCGAEDMYTRASGLSSSSNEYWHTEGMGRTALACNDLPSARAGLEASLEQAAKYLKDNPDDEDDVKSTKEDIVTIHETLVVVYNRQHEKKLAADSCSAAHPDWKGCACAFSSDKVSCVEKK